MLCVIHMNDILWCTLSASFGAGSRGSHNEGRERWGGERRQEAAQKLLIGQLDRVASRGRLVCGASQISSTKVLLCA